jgi:hypothetical protein
VPGGYSWGAGAILVRISTRSGTAARSGTGRRTGVAATGTGTDRTSGSSSQARMVTGSGSGLGLFFLRALAFFAGTFLAAFAPAAFAWGMALPPIGTRDVLISEKP